MPRIVVTCGEQRASLACVRSLGRAGHEVHVVSGDGRSIAGASRWARSDTALGDPLFDANGYLQALAELVRALAADFVIPITEPALLAVLEAPEALAPARVPFPPLDTFLAVSDKSLVMEAARAVGIAVPQQTTLAAPEQVSRLSANVDHQLVLKPGRSVREGIKLGVTYIQAGQDAAEAVTDLPPEAFPLLVQERVEGPGTGVFLLRWQGSTLAAFAHRRLREKPPSGGVSVLRESVALDPELQRKAEALLDRLNWQGVAMVEFKVDARTRVPFIMEINGRFWGSLQLAIDAGVDFPRLLVEAAEGTPAASAPTYRVGIRSRWLLGDLDHLLIRLTRRRDRLNLPTGAPGRFATMLAFVLSFLPPTRSEVFRWTDPRPFMRETIGWLTALRQ